MSRFDGCITGVGAAAIAATLLCASAGVAYDDRPHAYRHAEPGNIDYYALVLSWSPTHCLMEGGSRGDQQCDAKQPDDFVLHGFWPQYAKGWPEDCYTGQRPWVPSAVINEMLGVMPSKGMIIHEYRTHGTCSGLSPADYFAAARIARDQVHIPAIFDDPKTQHFLSPEKIESEFIATNDWLTPDMIAVTCRRGKLFDVRICFGTDLQPRACGSNFNQKRLCPLRRVTVTVP
jgi:ribonuclease T2